MSQDEVLTQADSEAPVSPASMKFPGYEVIRELGRGGMGVVYEVAELATGQKKALKTIIPQVEAGERSLQLFLREASVLSQLNHRRIVRFKEISLVGGQLFFVMEYVDAVNLRDLLAVQPFESQIRVYCAVLCQVLEALKHAHSKGMVHRDIKPNNILVSRSGKRLSVKVADFGLAKHFDSAGFSGLTPAGKVCGTAHFMPPEQFLDSCSVKPSADIYACGICLYHFISGQYPYRFSSMQEAQTVLLADDPLPLNSLCPSLSPELGSVIHRAIAKEPHDRWPSAQAMRRALLPFARQND